MKKCGENLKAKIYEPEGQKKNKNVRDLYGTSVTFRRFTGVELI